MSNLYNLLKTIIEKLNATKDTVNNLPQPDWNQNDETAPDFVKNRPFYTGDPVETVLVEERTVTFADTGYGFYGAEVASTFEATVGETYKVSWDGTVYECICEPFGDISIIGNLSIRGTGSDTGEPFLIGISDDISDGKGIEIITADTSASHTISISGMVIPVVKIDKKYLVQPDWNQNDSTAADFVKNRPFYEDTVREQLYSYIGDVTTRYDDTYYVADLSTPLDSLYSGLNITVVINHDGIENTYTNVPIEEYYVGGGTYLFDYLGGKDGYPFKITSNKLYVTASGHYTVYVYKNSQTIKQIPSKFIPIDNNGVRSGSTEHFATNYQIKSYVANEIRNALNAIGVAEEGAY